MLKWVCREKIICKSQQKKKARAFLKNIEKVASEHFKVKYEPGSLFLLQHTFKIYFSNHYAKWYMCVDKFLYIIYVYNIYLSIYLSNYLSVYLSNR